MRPEESFVGQNVRSLQTMLRVIGKDSGKTTTLIPDGYYGAQTRKAVQLYQLENGIPSTGAADAYTWSHIAKDYPHALIRQEKAQPLQLILNPNQIITANQQHPYVYLVQAMLAALDATYGALGTPPMSGVLDDATMIALAEFQRLNQLPQTGELDKVTWKHLALHYPLAVNQGHSQNRITR